MLRNPSRGSILSIYRNSPTSDVDPASIGDRMVFLFQRTPKSANNPMAPPVTQEESPAGLAAMLLGTSGLMEALPLFSIST